MIKISKEERDTIVAVMLRKYKDFKVNAMSEEEFNAYQIGAVDLLDSVVHVFGSYQIIYDVATLRNTLEEKMEEVDAEEN